MLHLSQETSDFIAGMTFLILGALVFIGFARMCINAEKAKDDRKLDEWEKRQRALYQEREAEHERRAREREVEYQRKRQEQADEFERNRLAVAEAALKMSNKRKAAESEPAPEPVVISHNEPVAAPTINLPTAEALESMDIYTSADEGD